MSAPRGQMPVGAQGQYGNPMPPNMQGMSAPGGMPGQLGGGYQPKVTRVQPPAAIGGFPVPPRPPIDQGPQPGRGSEILTPSGGFPVPPRPLVDQGSQPGRGFQGPMVEPGPGGPFEIPPRDLPPSGLAPTGLTTPATHVPPAPGPVGVPLAAPPVGPAPAPQNAAASPSYPVPKPGNASLAAQQLKRGLFAPTPGGTGKWGQVTPGGLPPRPR
jgi:hypothetical protein